MTATAEIEVLLPGMLEVLSVGKGDIKLTIGTPEEIAQAREIIEEMLRKGYTIFVEGAGGVTRRVKRFNAKAMTYVIADAPSAPAKAGRPRKAAEKRVPVAGSRARAVGRTAGG